MNYIHIISYRNKPLLFFEYFIRQKLKTCFTQGLDIRLINPENAQLLSQILYYDLKFTKRRLYFAFDDPKLEPVIIEKVQLLANYGIKPEHLLFYVIVGFNTSFEEDMRRFEVLDKLGCLPFIKPYNNRKDVPILNKFARWVNRRYYKVCTWVDFQKGKRGV